MSIKKSALTLLTTVCTLFLASCTNQNAQTKTPTEKTPLPQTAQKSQPQPSPTAQPFQEMTIPYLRARSYSSTLGELQKFADNGSFTSYTTSYTSDNLKINALLTQPKGERPSQGWPAIVFVHGYIPPNQYRTTEKYVEYVNGLGRNGFVVLKIDLRGHGQSEGEPGGGYYSSDYIIDTLNARAALQSTDFVNPQSIGLWGHSMAGNVTLRAFAAQPDIPAVVVWAGAGFTYQDLRDYRITDSSYRPQPSTSDTQRKRQELFDTYGQFNSTNEFWKQVVPTNYLSDIKGAIQLHHATDDTVVNVKYSQNLNALLDRTIIEHSYYEYPSGGHNISGPNFNQAMQRTVDFYKQRL